MHFCSLCMRCALCMLSKHILVMEEIKITLVLKGNHNKDQAKAL